MLLQLKLVFYLYLLVYKLYVVPESLNRFVALPSLLHRSADCKQAFSLVYSSTE